MITPFKFRPLPGIIQYTGPFLTPLVSFVPFQSFYQRKSFFNDKEGYFTKCMENRDPVVKNPMTGKENLKIFLFPLPDPVLPVWVGQIFFNCSNWIPIKLNCIQ